MAGNEKNENKLVEIAKRLDQLSSQASLIVDIATDDELTASERKELQRIQSALMFLRGAKGYETLGLQNQDTQKEYPLVDAEPDRTNDFESDAGNPIAEHSEFSDTGNRSLASESTQADSESTLATLGRFEMVRKIGEGGFAIVWLAHDPDLNRPVALKLLKLAHFASDEVKMRFDREARAAAALNHPNIVPVYETGVFEGERYIAAEYCPGDTLEEWIKENPINQRLAATFVAQLAEALQHAHQRGVMHRDLKPANIMVAPLDEAAGGVPQLKITDFGLAKHFHSDATGATIEDAILGTPAYMSPEQASGTQEISPATDIYSLGAILYELLTGRVPHLGEGHIDTLIAIRNKDPKPPSKFNPSVSKDFEAICLKCLQRNPTDRYPDPHQLALDLNRWLAGEVVVARRPTVIERAAKFCQRNPVVATAMLVIGLALGVAVWQWYGAQRHLAHAQSETNRANRYLGKMTDVVDSILEDIEHAAEPSLVTPTQRKRLREILTIQQSLVNDEGYLNGVQRNTLRTYARIAAIQNALDDFSGAEDTYEKAHQWLVESAWDDDDQQTPQFIGVVVDLYLDQADNRRRMNRTDKAIEILGRVEHVLDGHGEKLSLIERLEFSLTHQLLSGLANEQAGQSDQALGHFSAAVEIGDELLSIEANAVPARIVPIAAARIGLARSFRDKRDFESAMKMTNDCEVLLRECIERHPNAINAIWSLSSVIDLQQFLHPRVPSSKIDIRQRLLESITLLRKLVALAPLNSNYQIHLADKIADHAQAIARDDWELASREFDEAISICRPLAKNNRPARNKYLWILDMKAWAMAQRRKLEQALELSSNAIAEATHWVETNPNYYPTRYILAVHWQHRVAYLSMARRSQSFVDEVPSCYRHTDWVLKNCQTPLQISQQKQLLASIRGMEALNLARLRRWEDAVESAHRCLEVTREVNGKERKRYIKTAGVLGQVTKLWAAADEVDSDRLEFIGNSAIEFIQLAIDQYGYDRVDVLRKSPDFEYLRTLPKFETLIESIKRTQPAVD